MEHQDSNRSGGVCGLTGNGNCSLDSNNWLNPINRLKSNYHIKKESKGEKGGLPSISIKDLPFPGRVLEGLSSGANMPTLETTDPSSVNWRL